MKLSEVQKLYEVIIMNQTKLDKIEEILKCALADVNFEDNAARYLDNILEIIRWNRT